MARTRQRLLRINVEALEILDRLAKGNDKGQLLGRLLFEHQARVEERQKLLAELKAQQREEEKRAILYGTPKAG